MDKYTCIIVASKLESEQLKDFLIADDEAEVIGITDQLKEAIALINQMEPQVLFLSVAMPSINSFDILAKIKKQPTIIFLTENDPTTIKTFEDNRLSYLTKPLKKEALDQKLTAFKQTHQQLATKMQGLLGKLKFDEKY